MLLNEINILRQIDHPNIVKMHRLYEDEETVSLVLDLITGQTLLNLIWREDRLPEPMVAKLAG
jgi:calcium-dependent protein kinase